MTQCLAYMLNDAEAPGFAEMNIGAGKCRAGIVIVVTFGTGIGSVILLDGRLVPNIERGHIEIRGEERRRKSTWRRLTKRDPFSPPQEGEKIF